MPLDLSSILIGAAGAAAVCLLAQKLRLLTPSGAAVALVVGTLVFGIGGVPYSVPLLVFFASSSALSRLSNQRKRCAMSLAAKGHARDGWQVLANGGVAAAIVVLSALMPPGGRPSSRDWSLLYLSALAAANADTWATEIGTLTSATPRLITTLRAAPAGASGAISVTGTLAGLLGAGVIVLSALFSWPLESPYLLWPPDAAEMLAIAWAGFIGMMADSILGASLQAQYECGKCGGLSESPLHCGDAGTLTRGWRWVTNETVNLAGALVATVSAWYLLTTFAWPTQ